MGLTRSAATSAGRRRKPEGSTLSFTVNQPWGSRGQESRRVATDAMMKAMATISRRGRWGSFTTHFCKPALRPVTHVTKESLHLTPDVLVRSELFDVTQKLVVERVLLRVKRHLQIEQAIVTRTIGSSRSAALLEIRK